MLRLLAFALAVVQQPANAPRIEANSNRAAAGRMVGGELRVQLETRVGRWFPESERDPSAIVQAFAEVGRPAQIPGPLIRVKTGTRVNATIRNTLSTPLTLYGLHAHPGTQTDTLRVPPGASREVRFTAGAPGTYFYWGSTTGTDIESRDSLDSQLSGAIVVDSANAATTPRDRVFVLGVWHADRDTTGPKPWYTREQMVINGKSWPHTERFAFTVGDTVRWRWVNPTRDSHPMHLHGFYFDVASRGTWAADTVLPPAAHRRVVTELILPGGTISTSWVPTAAGSWLFHCHFPAHTAHFVSFKLIPDPDDPDSREATEQAVHGMRGLVLGIDVRVPRGVVAAGAPRPASTNAVRMLMQMAPRRYGDDAGYGFVVQKKPATIRRDSVPTLSPTLILQRGELARINLVNHLRAPAAVHWHGIELANSYYDGVPGWSGTQGRRAPLIAPNDSFQVEFTPPRAGTFIYHSHSNETRQITSGLYGALIVTEPGQPFDSTTNRVFVIGGSPQQGKGRLNGSLSPPAQRLVVGKTYRLRIVHIQPDFRVFVSLMSDSTPVRWRAVAKDGAELPPNQAVMQIARILMGPGETADFEITPRTPGLLRLDAVARLDAWRVSVPLRVERQ